MNRFTIKKDSWMTTELTGILFIFLLASITHFLFSHLGLNPTDDGWVLAGSRRIIEGQIPHRDFISFHISGSFYIHAPIVLFGGDYVFLISRYFVCLQFASIAWIWTIIIANSFKVFNTLVEKLIIALVAFSFSVHNFPIMAWYTVDGLFFLSLGIMLSNKEFRSAKLFGYILIGAAPLCKQVFLPMIPIALLLFKDWRRLYYWIAAIIPIAVFIIYLTFYGAIPDAILQLTSYTNFYHVMVAPFVAQLSFFWGIIVGCLVATYSTFDFKRLINTHVFYRVFGIILLFGIISSAVWALLEGSMFGYLEIIVGGLVAYLLYSTFDFKRLIKTNAPQRVFGILILFGIIFGAAWVLANWSIFGYFPAYYLSTSFSIFGAAIGIIIYFIARVKKFTGYLRSGSLAVFAAWCSTLSLGYQSPALMTGPLIIFLMASVQFFHHLTFEDRIPNNSILSISRWFSSHKSLQTLISILIILSVVSSLTAFGLARQRFIYREQSASQLTYDLGDVLPGAKGIKTNKNTYDYFKDLQNAKNIVKEKGKEYCIIPDTAANWVKDQQSNPLPCDWASNYVLGKQELLDRAISDLETKRGTIIIIVQKYQAEFLYKGFVPVSDKYKIVNYVRSNFDLTEETKYFELYE